MSFYITLCPTCSDPYASEKASASHPKNDPATIPLDSRRFCTLCGNLYPYKTATDLSAKNIVWRPSLEGCELISNGPPPEIGQVARAASPIFAFDEELKQNESPPRPILPKKNTTSTDEENQIWSSEENCSSSDSSVEEEIVIPLSDSMHTYAPQSYPPFQPTQENPWIKFTPQ